MQTNGLLLRPKIFRIACVLLHHALEDFPAGYRARWVQFIIPLIVISAGALEMWYLDPSRKRLLPFGSIDPTRPSKGIQELQPWSKDKLDQFQFSCQFLQAWIFFAHMYVGEGARATFADFIYRLPPSVLLFFVIMRWWEDDARLYVGHGYHPAVSRNAQQTCVFRSKVAF